MDRLINIGIYVVYAIIGCVSIGVATQSSLIFAGIVLALEGVRMIALYKKLPLAVFIVFLGNISLIGYSSYKAQEVIEYNQAQVKFVNEKTKNTLENTFQAKNVSSLSSDVKEIIKVSIDWWFMVGAYLFLELTLLVVVIGTNKQEKNITKPKNIKKDKYNGKNKSIQKEQSKIVEPQEDLEEKLEYLGSYREYAEKKGLSRSVTQELFKEYAQEGRIVTRNRKKYLKV